MFFANVMFYGLLVVLPGVLVIFGLTLHWLASSSSKMGACLGPRQFQDNLRSLS